MIICSCCTGNHIADWTVSLNNKQSIVFQQNGVQDVHVDLLWAYFDDTSLARRTKARGQKRVDKSTKRQFRASQKSEVTIARKTAFLTPIVQINLSFGFSQRCMTLLIYNLFLKNTRLTLNISILKVEFMKQDLSLISETRFKNEIFQCAF